MPANCILLVTMDECRYDALSCYGGRAIATPHMDALASAGIRFDRALTPSPVCLPARCALLSGQYPHRTGMISNTVERRLLPSTPNVFNLARRAGWTTAMTGKCHFTATPYDRLTYGKPLDGEPIRRYLLSLGLDHLALCDDKVGTFWFWDEYSRGLKEAGLFDQVAFSGRPAEARTFPGPEEWHPDVWTARQAIAYLAAHEAEKPLLLWVSFPGPHYPHDPPARYLDRVDDRVLPLLRWQEGEFEGGDKAHGKSFRRGADEPGPSWRCEGGGKPGGSATYTDEEWRQIQRHYFANVALIDDCVGELVAAARAKFGDAVWVVLTADHGDMMGAHRLWGKGFCAYEEVVKVPFLAAGPGFSGGPSNARVSLLDILPTVCGMVGTAVPQRCDGRDLRQSLADGGPELLFSFHAGLMIVDDGRWRLSINQLAGTVELYDRQTDPGEYVNLAHVPAGSAARQRLERAALDQMMTAALDVRQPPFAAENGFLQPQTKVAE